MFHSQWGIIKNAGVPRWQTIYQNISSSWNSGTDGLPLSKFWIWDQKVERWSHQYIIVRHFFEPKPHEAEYELRYVPLNPFRSLPRLPRFKWEKKTAIRWYRLWNDVRFWWAADSYLMGNNTSNVYRVLFVPSLLWKSHAQSLTDEAWKILGSMYHFTGFSDPFCQDTRIRKPKKESRYHFLFHYW